MRCRAEGGAILERKADEFGRVGGIPAGTYVVEASAPGHVPRRASVEVGVERRGVVELEPAATLVLAFRDAGGGPVPGTEAAVLPWRREGAWEGPWEGLLEELEALAAAPWGDRFSARGGEGRRRMLARCAPYDDVAETSYLVVWRKTADATGECVWDELPPGRYRWASSAIVDVDPPHERSRAVLRSDGSFELSERPPPGVSGAFELRRGEVRRIEVVARPGALVSGRVALEGTGLADGERAILRLLDCTAYDDERGGGLHDRTAESSSRSAQDGSFRIEGVWPGTKLLRALWRDEEGNVFFASRGFVIAAGEHQDLGTLAPLPGPPCEGRLRTVLDDGREIDPEVVFGRERPQALLLVACRPHSGSMEESVIEALDVEIGRPFVLHGLPAGPLWLEVKRGLDWTRPRHYRVDPPSVELSHPGPGPILLDVVCRPQYTVRLALPAVMASFRAEAWVLSESTGETGQTDLRPLRPGQTAVELNLVGAGRQHLLVHSNALEGPTENLFFQHTLEFDPAAPRDVQVEFREGAVVRGEVRGSDGRPRAGESVFVTFGRWRDHDHPYGAITDRDGRFVLQGLVPRQSYLFHDGTEVEVGGPGTETFVVVGAYED